MLLVILAAMTACDRDVRLEEPVQDKNTGEWSYANKNGKTIIAAKYDLAEGFNKDSLAQEYVGTLHYGMQEEGK